MYIFEVRRLEKYLTNKMLFEFHSSNGKLVRTGEEFWFPDDVTIGYIIGTVIMAEESSVLWYRTSTIYFCRAFARPNLDRDSPFSFSSRSFENCGSSGWTNFRVIHRGQCHWLAGSLFTSGWPYQVTVLLIYLDGKIKLIQTCRDLCSYVGAYLF